MTPSLKMSEEVSGIRANGFVSTTQLTVDTSPYTGLFFNSTYGGTQLVFNLPVIKRRTLVTGDTTHRQVYRTKVWNGTEWVYVNNRAWDGARWVGAPIKVWDGSTWS